MSFLPADDVHGARQTSFQEVLATLGLRAYPFIGAAWMAHVAWDVAHHLHGEPILRFDASSSLGCAVCDTVIAVWFFAGAPSPFHREGRDL
ncbi:MAG: DUF6010 family protein [Myxococcota bacterium]